MAKEMITGSCNCGAISIEFPKSAYPENCAKCHCQGCRASSGGLFSINLSIPHSEVKIVRGTPKIYADKDTMSGKPVRRNFCGDCGCAIFSLAEADNQQTAFVKGGLFVRQDTALPPPGAEIFWHRREEWEEPTKGIKPQ